MTSSKQPNLQNMHVLDSHIDSSLAIQRLISMGITVLEVRFGSIKPVIVVQASAETQKLKGTVVRSIRRNGEQQSRCSVLMNNCRIEWEHRPIH